MKNMQTILTCLLFLFSSVSSNAQITSSSQWTWLNGANTTLQPGVYGTLGTPDTANRPGARTQSATWTDTAGNFWLFGGYGRTATNLSWLNDLWKYNPATNQWTWVKGANTTGQPGVYGTLGSPDTANRPGARSTAAFWTDSAGNFWLFGGFGQAASSSTGLLNDLWKYNPATNQWTWVNGTNILNQPGVYGTLGTPAAANRPGARYYGASCTDASGNLWLFGGDGGNGYFNDLWKYSPATNQWTWVNGSNSTNQPPVYGVMGTPAAANHPSARTQGVAWTDATGNFWMFGGNDIYGNKNDLWKYDPITNQWTWVKGSIIPAEGGVYGTLGVPAAANTPRARKQSLSWTDRAGNFWLFGGFSYVSTSNYKFLHDLWRYNPGTNQWTWINGSGATDQPGVYGTMGTPAAANKPGARYEGASWTDAGGNLWLFGGFGFAASSSGGYLNDLWKLSNVSPPFTSANDGNWSAPSTWVGGVVPPPDAVVVVQHNITVQTNASCYSLKTEGPSGNVTVKTGVQLIVLH